MSPTTRPFPRRTWLAALLAAPVIALFAAAPAHADALDTIAKNGTLRVAVPEDYPPFGSVGTDMQPQGYDIDMAGLLAKSLGVKLKLVPVNSANRIPYLTTNKVDMVISSLGKTPEREKVIDFSSAYAPYFQGVFGPSDVKVSTPADLTGKTVGATRGALEEIALSQLAPNATIKRFEDNNATIQAFLSGQVQLIAAGNIVAAAILAKNPPRRPEVKFVIKDRADYEYAREVVQRYGLERRAAALLFSPVHGVLDPKMLSEWILADKLPVRLQVQLHKYVWEPTTRGV